MKTLKQKTEESCGFGVTPADVRLLLQKHIIDSPIVYAAHNLKHAHGLSDLYHMTMLAFHAIIALEETQAAAVAALQAAPVPMMVRGE